MVPIIQAVAMSVFAYSFFGRSLSLGGALLGVLEATESPSDDSAAWILELSLGGAFLAAEACFSSRAFRCALIFGRGSRLGDALEAGSSLGGSLGAVLTFQAGLALGAAPDLVAVMLMKSRS